MPSVTEHPRAITNQQRFQIECSYRAGVRLTSTFRRLYSPFSDRPARRRARATAPAPAAGRPVRMAGCQPREQRHHPQGLGIALRRERLGYHGVAHGAVGVHGGIHQHDAGELVALTRAASGYFTCSRKNRPKACSPPGYTGALSGRLAAGWACTCMWPGFSTMVCWRRCGRRAGARRASWARATEAVASEQQEIGR